MAGGLEDEGDGLPVPGPDPRTEAGRANLELQRRRPVCRWCAGGACYPAWPADRFVRTPEGRLAPACRFHADEGTGEEHSVAEGLRLVLVEGVQES